MSFHSQRFGRAAETYSAHAEVQKKMGDILLGLLPEMTSGEAGTHPRILEMGCGTGLFTEKLIHRFPGSDFWITDASEKMLGVAQQKILEEKSLEHFSRLGHLRHKGRVSFSILDASADAKIAEVMQSEIELSAPYDLAASNALVQWFPDLAKHFRMTASLLAAEGLYLVSGFTQGNFPELNSLLQEPPFNYREFPGHSEDDVRLAASQADLKMESWHSEPLETIYPSPEAFLATLSGLGSSRRPGTAPLTQSRLVYLVEQYRARYSCLGGIKATWVPWYALLRKTQLLMPGL